MTGLLTILGFSLYDTVVVFDKVRENTADLRGTRQTYAEAANLAVNQTLVRSINTSIVALIPVGCILYVGVVQLGSGSLKDLALALFVGMAAGVYSSVFIATPLLVHLKSRESEVVLAEKRAKARRRARPTATPRSPRSPRTCRSPTSRGSTPTDPATGGRRCQHRRLPPRSPEASGRGRVGTVRAAAGAEERRVGSAAAEPAAAVQAGQEVAVPTSVEAAEALERLVIDVPDFPEPGVVFKDITPLLADHDALPRSSTRSPPSGATRRGRSWSTRSSAWSRAASSWRLRSRSTLGAGFVPVRKAGKLPRETHAVSYALEYGEATLELHRDAISPGDRVLLVDDVLATGGTRQRDPRAGREVRRCRGGRRGADGARVPARPGDRR